MSTQLTSVLLLFELCMISQAGKLLVRLLQQLILVRQLGILVGFVTAHIFGSSEPERFHPDADSALAPQWDRRREQAWPRRPNC